MEGKNNNLIISIDGPAGSGKERIAKYIANKYNLFHLDSGILYRRLASLLIKKKINLNNEYFINKYIKSIKILSARSHPHLRKEVVSQISSEIAKLQFVRNFINRQQKLVVKSKLKTKKGCVVDGRDIGSKVFKEARIKLYIDVNIRIRAKRRHKQLIAMGEKSIYAQILKEMKLRDKNDKNRKNSPLVIPKGAIIINNSDNFTKTINLINQALNLIK